MLKKIWIISALFFLAGAVIAADQWLGWHYWASSEQFSLLHHEGWALLLTTLSVVLAFFNVILKRRSAP